MGTENRDLKAIYETRDEKMISLKDEKPRFRTARFLKPCANQDILDFPSPLLSQFFPHDLQKWPSQVVFKGWKQPQRKWGEWVTKLAPKYTNIWKKTGIYDAIMSSVCEIRLNEELVLGLCEFWCSNTNTFVFPWGEATITLEDVMILGGFPVLGRPAITPLSSTQLSKIEKELENIKARLGRSRAKKAEHSCWINQFMESDDRNTETEHAAFLALWLSRYVFPSPPENVISKHVFPIAAHLSHGISIGLAPAVLSSLYRDLSALTNQALKNYADGSSSDIVIFAPFQLVQLWAFERFPHLGPNRPNLFHQPGQPRASRWDKLNSKSNIPIVRSALKLIENFRWRPYAANLLNWRHPSYYKETEQRFLGTYGLDKELRSFCICLQSFELLGLGCKEKYLPHRVAMQFGFDQDLPATHSESSFKSSEHVRFYVPSLSFEPCVSARYLKWWKDSMLARKGSTKNVLTRKGSLMESMDSTTSLYKTKVSRAHCHGSVVKKEFNLPKPVPNDSLESITKRNYAPPSPHCHLKSQAEVKQDWIHEANLQPRSVLGRNAMNRPATKLVQPKSLLSRKCSYSAIPDKSRDQTSRDKKGSYGVAGHALLATAEKHRTLANAYPCNSPENVSPRYCSKLSTTREDSPKTNLSTRLGSKVEHPRGRQDIIDSIKYKNVAKEMKRKPGDSVSEQLDSEPSEYIITLSQRFKQRKGAIGTPPGNKHARPKGRRDVFDSDKYRNVVAKEMKRKCGDSAGEQSDLGLLDYIPLSQRIKQRKGGLRGSAGKKWEIKAKAQEYGTSSVSVHVYTNVSQEAGLESRVQTIEKLLGVNCHCAKNDQPNI